MFQWFFPRDVNYSWRLATRSSVFACRVHVASAACFASTEFLEYDIGKPLYTV